MPDIETSVPDKKRPPNGSAPQKNVYYVKGEIDIWFLLISVALLLFGIVMAFSASSIYADQYRGDSLYFLKKHLLFVALALIPTVIVVWLGNPILWKAVSLPAYGGAAMLLVLVLFIGTAEGEAQRWIYVGPVSVQPSEVAKLALILFLSLWMARYEKEIASPFRFGGSFKYGVLFPGMIIGFLCGLIALEKHISGLMIVGLLGIVIMFLGGTKLRWILLICGVIGLAAVGLVFVSDYAQGRVEIWLHIDQMDSQGLAWQTLQGLYAIGNGGLFGVGLGESAQKFGYVSQPQNDFIFTIVCEELGFFGALLAVVLFGLFVWRGYKLAAKAPDTFCSLVTYGLVTKVGLQAILNIAVVTNSMPNTGISLPFFSSGGSSLMLQIFEVGIILSISRFSLVRKEGSAKEKYSMDDIDIKTDFTVEDEPVEEKEPPKDEPFEDDYDLPEDTEPGDTEEDELEEQTDDPSDYL